MFIPFEKSIFAVLPVIISLFVCLRSVQVLADIELAQTLKSETEKAQEEMVETVPHPLDQDYMSLKCRLTLLDPKTEMFKVSVKEYV